MEIIKGRQDAPVKIVVYGTPGIGKTTLASKLFEKPLFIETEDGSKRLDVDRLPLCKSQTDVQQQLQWAIKEAKGNGYDTIVVDSADWLERLIWSHLVKSEGVDSIEKVGGGYGKGYRRADEILRNFLKFSDMIVAAGLNVCYICHSDIEHIDDLDVASYDRHALRLHKHARASLFEWCEACLFAHEKVRVKVEEGGKGFGQDKATAVGSARVLRCEGRPGAMAKNRFGLPAELPMDAEFKFVEVLRSHLFEGAK